MLICWSHDADAILSLQQAASRLQATAAACASALIEWVDGPLVQAMKQGDVLLLDELNLAEDAVLERLNRWALCYASLFTNAGMPHQ